MFDRISPQSPLDDRLDGHYAITVGRDHNIIPVQRPIGVRVNSQVNGIRLSPIRRRRREGTADIQIRLLDSRPAVTCRQRRDFSAAVVRLSGIRRRRRGVHRLRLLPIGCLQRRHRLLCGCRRGLERPVGVDFDALRLVGCAAADDVVAEEEADAVSRRLRYVDPELRRRNQFGDGTRFATVDEIGARVGPACVRSLF